jgi:centrosomal protein CEP104
MLTSCKQCEQVVEISSLTEHILRDCEGAGTHRACPRCGEAVPTTVFGDHVARASCLSMLIHL